jgi:hypothetical protein
MRVDVEASLIIADSPAWLFLHRLIQRQDDDLVALAW